MAIRRVATRDRTCRSGRPCLSVLVLILILLSVDFASAGVIYVDRDAAGANNGASWANAYRALTSALSAATSGDEIWVAEGTYKPNDASGSTSRSQWFQLKNGVAVYGGFAGTETTRSQRAITTHPVILSGDLNGDDADANGDGFPEGASVAENCYHVLYHPFGLGLNASAVLDGVTIRGGWANGSSPHNMGGGIYNDSSSPTLTSCAISGNFSSGYGGGIYNRSSASTITNCTLSGNAGSSGGGVYQIWSSSRLTNCTISGNSAGVANGGGICNSSCSPTITNCTLSGNSASSLGGGIYNATSSSPSITNCTLTGNSATSDGGGICNVSSSSPVITNCILWGNWAVSQISNSASTPIVDHCVIQDGYTSGTTILTDDPLLMALGNYGGATATMPPASGSPAVDAGVIGSAVPGTDQRGFARTGVPDIGACEQFALPLAASVGADHPQHHYLEGASASLTARAEGVGLSYQWFLGANGDTLNPIPGATAQSYQTPSLARGEHSFWVRVSYGGGSVDSPAAILVAVPPILCVSTVGSDLNDGVTWLGALRTLSHALQIAAPGCEIWLAEGTYKPNDASHSNSRTQWFQMRDGVAIYGGFAGIETGRGERDPAAYPVILSGDLNGDDADLDGDGLPDSSTMGDNCPHVFYHIPALGLTQSAVLDGVTIRGGFANSVWPHSSGAGIFNSKASPTLKNCTISGHLATNGGAIYNTGLSSPAITGSTLSHNYASYGGGIYNASCSPAVTGCTLSRNSSWKGAGIYNASSSPTITNCTFLANTATSDSGGGIFNSASSPVVTNCTLSGNSAGDRGGGIYSEFSSPTLTRCTLSGNSATYEGGGIYDWLSPHIITDCTFSGNSAPNGGGIYASMSSPAITRCTFSSNVAGAGGGGIYIVGYSPTITNCTFSGNDAGSYGGGIYSRDAAPTLTNCTLSGNSAFYDGGGIYYNSSEITIINCILWGNLGASQIVSNGSITVDHCIIQGGYPGGTNILTSDPLLLPLGNYGGVTPTMPLAAGSCAIDAGTVGASVPATDQRGFTRAGAPDIGACEFQAAALAGAAPALPGAIGSAPSVEVRSDCAAPTYQWYFGQSGDTSQPIAGATGSSLSLPPLDLGTSVWVRVTPSGGGAPHDSDSRNLEVRGTFEDWCDFHGLTGGDRAPDACPSGDGIDNLMKFALALDPAVPASLSSRSAAGYEAGTQTLKQTWILSKTPTDLVLGGEWSRDLQSWSADGVTATVLQSDAGVETREISVPVAGEARGYLRLHVETTP